MRTTTSWIRAGLGILLAFSASVASAQIEPGTPGWFVRATDVAGTIDNFERHNNVLAQGAVNQIDDSVAEVIIYNRANFGVDAAEDLAWPVDLQEDFVVRAIADVTIPAGEWGVGWGSDDGGQIHIPGVEFATRFNTAGDLQPDDQLIFDGNRGYNTTWGSFSLSEPLETTVNVSMWERGGGDNFDVFYINLEEQYDIEAADLTDAATDTPSLDNLWGLLGVGDLADTDAQGDWNVRTPASIPPVAIPVSPGQGISGASMNVTSEMVGDVQPGLLHHWYGIANPGSLEGAAAFYDINAGPIENPDIPAFNPENTWWTGNQAPIEGGTTDVPKYPANIIDQERNDGTSFNDTDNSNYTVGLTGQLRFPRDGEYTFTDGVDDLTVFAVDVDRDGEFDPDTEILINDNAWTSLNRDSNDGGFPNDYVPITVDVPEDGNCEDADNASDLCWFDVEAIFGEGGGTDAGIIYWNENADVEFPVENGDGRIIADEDISELAIPESFMRAPGGINITGGDAVATLNNEFPYAFDIAEDGTADSLTVNRPLDVFSTALDLNGAEIQLVGDAIPDGEYQLFSADSISGEVSVSAPEGVMFDDSRLATEGVLVIGEGGGGGGGDSCEDLAAARIPGDADGSGDVGFLDFLALANNFGTEGGYAEGNFDCTGTVSFLDFLTLANNFGNSAAAEAASVPEPSAALLLGLGGLVMGLFRRRRA